MGFKWFVGVKLPCLVRYAFELSDRLETVPLTVRVLGG
jgi:hypothetical protein